MGKNCYKCGYNPCTCDLGTVIKQMAAPVFTEDLYKFATENGLFTGTLEEFILYMKGPQGDSVYEWAVKNGFTTLPKEEWYNQYIGTMSYSVDEWSGTPSTFTMQRNQNKPGAPKIGDLHFLKKSSTGVKLYVVDEAGELRTEIPDYPETGSYTLKSVDGVLLWVLDS